MPLLSPNLINRRIRRDPSLVLDLPLYKLDGSTFKSRDIYGRLNTVTGALWTPSGRTFNGTTDKVNCGANPETNITSQITLEVWIKFSATNNGKGILTKYGALAANAQYMLYFGAANQFTGLIHTTTDREVSTPATYNDGNWHHVIVTYDGTIRVYVDRVQVASLATTGAIQSTTTTVDIGSFNNGNYFNGQIGVARIYNRVLTPMEVEYNYLVTRWRYQ